MSRHQSRQAVNAAHTCDSARRSCLLALGMLAICVVPASAQRIQEDWVTEPVPIHSGRHTLAVAADEPMPVFREIVEAPGTNWMQLGFGDYHLGTGSYVTLTSLLTGEVQPLDAEGMEMWSQSSAYLAGDAVEITLYAHPDDDDVFVNVQTVTTPAWELFGELPPDGGVASLCNDTDTRGPSNDQRVGRISGCTAWLVSTGVVLSAGHCEPFSGVMEFNVPNSNTNGNPNWAPLSEQFPIINGSSTWRDGGPGDDWAVFRIGTAADGSGRRAHIEKGFFQMTTRVPPESAVMRVTGYGLDNRPPGSGGPGAHCCAANGDGVCQNNCNSSSRTLQTATGRFDELDGNMLEYEVDTLPANSGGPVIRNLGGHAVGIHTHGGCDSFWVGYENHGTWFGHSGLSTALNNYLGTNTVFVTNADVSALQVGSALHPAKTVGMGTALVPNGGTVLIAAGSYTAAAGNTFTAGTGNKAMTLTTNTGVVVIGN